MYCIALCIALWYCIALCWQLRLLSIPYSTRHQPANVNDWMLCILWWDGTKHKHRVGYLFKMDWSNCINSSIIYTACNWKAVFVSYRPVSPLLTMPVCTRSISSTTTTITILYWGIGIHCARSSKGVPGLRAGAAIGLPLTGHMVSY